MSAIAKPFIHSTAVVGGLSDLVPVEHIAGISKNVRKSSPTASSEQFLITFKMKENSDVLRDIVWVFDLEATRDSEYTKVVTAISTAIV